MTFNDPLTLSQGQWGSKVIFLKKAKKCIFFHNLIHIITFLQLLTKMMFHYVKMTLTLTQGQRSEDQENTLFWPNFDWLGNSTQLRMRNFIVCMY